jgi:Zn-dependent protease
MGSEIPLGRIAGIRIGFNWSVVVIAALYVAGLAVGEFPNSVPGMSSAAYWLAGIFGAVLFFASLLGHELAHAFLARREGMKVEGITLWLLGGVSKLEGEPPDAGAELRIAIVGPLASLALAGVFWACRIAAHGVGTSELLAVVFGWLALINLLLAGFNIIPAAPLDGGRVLAAALWWRTGDSTKATVWAGKVGQALGGGLVAVGLFMLLGKRADMGIWLALVGWYIAAAGGREAQSAPLIAVLKGMHVRDVMTPDPPLAQDWMTVDGVLASIPPWSRSRAFPVQGFDGRISGLLTSDQIEHVDPWHRANLRVPQVAFPIDRVLVARVDDDVLPTLQQLGRRPTSEALVVWPDGRVAGIIGPDDVQRVLQARGMA